MTYILLTFKNISDLRLSNKIEWFVLGFESIHTVSHYNIPSILLIRANKKLHTSTNNVLSCVHRRVLRHHFCTISSLSTALLSLTERNCGSF